MTEDVVARANTWLEQWAHAGERAPQPLQLVRDLSAEVQRLEAKLALEIENNIAVGGLLKRFEAERKETIDVLERTLIAAGVPLPGVPK